MDNNITVCRGLMPPRLLLRLVPPPLLQPQARALARYVSFLMISWGSKFPSLLCIFHCRCLWDALWSLSNSPLAIIAFFPPRNRQKETAPVLFRAAIGILLVWSLRAESVVANALFVRSHRSTPLSLFPVLNSTNAPVVGTRKSSACTSVDGTVVRRLMVH
jgi:hypothetical protein